MVWAARRTAQGTIGAWPRSAARLSGATMRLDQLSFESLKAYPPLFVAGCVGVLLAAVLMLIAKPLKWGMYLMLGGVYVLAMGALLAWLWRG